MHAAIHSLALNPLLDDAAVHDVLARHWRIRGELSDLGSLQDQNVRVRTPSSSYVLKIVPDSADLDQVRLQNEAMRHVDRSPGRRFASPSPMRAVNGSDVVAAHSVYCRLLTWVPGRPYAARPWLRPTELRALGALNADVATTLAAFEHPELDRVFLWDPRRSAQVVADLEGQLTDRELRARLRAAVAPLDRSAPDLPVAPVHGDLTPTNVVGEPSGEGGRSSLTGVLDFGDVMRTWRLADVSAAVVGVVEHPGVDDPLEAALAVLGGYHDVRALTGDEAEAFWPLVLARAGVNAAVSLVQSALSPSNWYATRGAESARRALEALTAVPMAVASAGAHAVIGGRTRSAGRGPVGQVGQVEELVPGLHTARVLDLGVDTDELVDGAWRDADPVAALVPDGTVAIGRWGENRLTRSGELSAAAPDNLHLGVDVYAPAGTAVRLPVAGRVTAIVPGTAGDTLLVEPEPGCAPDRVLRLAGLVATCTTGTLVAGAELGTVAAAQRPALHVQLVPDPAVPRFGSPRHRAAWLEACPDPSDLLGVHAAAPRPAAPEDERRRRERVVAAPQHLYFDQPVRMVRGWRHFLYDDSGRARLDMINNIAAIGHAHPAVTAAAARQLTRLNTNSRFLYDAMTTYSERIAELMPPSLDQVFLVNSGSEAADLALQLARSWTGRFDVAAVAGAYHGWTGAVLALSSSPNDRPGWAEEWQPGHHVVAAPNPYRGVHGDDVDAYVSSVEQACAAAAARGGLAAFVCEPLLGNQGAVEPAPGWLARSYEVVRRAGGLCIADEVQVGIARTGDFWAFEYEGVEPDIVYTAKAAGNGHPLGVVACRREVADAFDRSAAFFASTGGGPVSCEIGTAVLDTIRAEGLQHNAREVGAHLKARLAALASVHDLVGAVHGRGLYLGVELVLDRETRAPAAAAADAVSERLLDLGVVMQPTGDALNVLKVKPPLCIDRAAADFFVDRLDDVLTQLRRGAA